MEEKMKISEEKKETLLQKAGGVLENVKEKVEEKSKELISKAKESKLAEIAKEKLGASKKEPKK